ncbi:unnamed protein product [Victoria cruziana]
MENLHAGKFEYGCKHYRRRCKIRAPCCNQVFACRHCHNEIMNHWSSGNPHELSRRNVETVICAVCDTEQKVSQVCVSCGVNMGEYFCGVCKFYDDDIGKEQFHCIDCGICRVGGAENYFHCKKCGSCYSTKLQGNHSCVENSMRHNCPVCNEYLFDSLLDTTVLKCGHTMHLECLQGMAEHDQYSCPICSKTMFDMSKVWKKMDDEVAATIMPEDYRYKKVWILCNDCSATSEVLFHVIGLKCETCGSYNTRKIATPTVNGEISP